MYSEARKINIIEEVLKITNESTLVALEAVIKQSKKESSKKEKQPSIYDFVGMLTKKEAIEMRRAIEETCETIHPDDWK